MTQESKLAIKKECERQEESCLYTSTCLYLLSRNNRRLGNIVTVVQIVAGVLITTKQLEKSWNATGITWYSFIGLSVLVTCMPLINKHFRLSELSHELLILAGKFKNLQDDFRRLKEIGSTYEYKDYKKDYELALKELKSLKSQCPETSSVYNEADKQIKSGKYTFTTDEIAE